MTSSKNSPMIFFLSVSDHSLHFPLFMGLKTLLTQTEHDTHRECQGESFYFHSQSNVVLWQNVRSCI